MFNHFTGNDCSHSIIWQRHWLVANAIKPSHSNVFVSVHKLVRHCQLQRFNNSHQSRWCFSWKHTKHKISSLDWIGSPHNNWSRQRDCFDNVLDMFPWKHT